MALFVFKFSDSQFERLIKYLRGICVAIEDGNLRTTAGFDKVAKAIADLSTPEPLPDTQVAVKGILMGRYNSVEGQAPFGFDLVSKDLKSAAGTPVGAQDIDLSVESSSANLGVSLGAQTLSEDGMSVSAPVTFTPAASMPTTELAVVTYKATNRDTGNQVNADVDEFVTGPGEAVIGTLDTPVPLEEIP